MSVDSLLDMIRISSGNKKTSKEKFPSCNFKGCSEPGRYPAPFTTLRSERLYINLCEHHIKVHNKNYNYFHGMSEEEFKDYYDQELVGQRPTWNKAHNFSNTNYAKAKVDTQIKNADFLNFNWQDFNKEKTKDSSDHEHEQEVLLNKTQPLRMRALNVLGLDSKATHEHIKKRYKALVKKYHPDINKDNKLVAERLRNVIEAYKQLSKNHK